MEDGTVVGWQDQHPHVTAVVVVHERLHSADWREEMMGRHPAADNGFEAATEAALKAIKDINAAIDRGEEPQGAYRWVTVYEVNGDAAVPLPAGWFDGPRDERYGYTRGRLRPPLTRALRVEARAPAPLCSASARCMRSSPRAFALDEQPLQRPVHDITA
jgi:hypothetical protein